MSNYVGCFQFFGLNITALLISEKKVGTFVARRKTAVDPQVENRRSRLLYDWRARLSVT